MDIPGYQIHREIGRGGMATAYLAIQQSLGREVVLKVLDFAAHCDNESLIERFLAEGRIVATLNHPNIITIFDIGIAEDALYISMEYVEGGDLKSRMGSPLDPIEALEYLNKIGSALEDAHQNGIIHRDVKPANILFRDDNTLLLTDFGIAKQIDIDNELTATGMFIGSPNYVSPEQAEGSEVDGRSDIYSLGCIFYEMLTGLKPYQAKNVLDIVIKHKQAPIPTLPEDLQRFQPLLNKMMAKDPKDRFENAAIMNAYIKNQLKKHKPTTLPGIDIGLSNVKAENKGLNKRLPILIVSLFLSASVYGTLNYLEIKIRSNTNLDDVTTETSLSNITQTSAQSVDTPIISNTTNNQNTLPTESKEVINALLWLGKQSLENYKLTYPAKDNAYYYFTRLLEIDPQNQTARLGLLNIADRYAILAEQSLANNEYDKADAYINIGLTISPKNETLLAIRELNNEISEQSFFDALKSFFSS